MRSISDTLTRLAALRAAAPGAQGDTVPNVLETLEGFGTNPGALQARYHVPAGLGPQAPLVVVLHGCTQTAAGYDHGSGWTALADRAGFAVLFPEQKRANNPNLCFNWFMPEDTRRGGGEACSISEMIAAMVRAHDLDPGRVYVTGLSAGGAMAAVMLATYPELFAGGAIIAGLPFGSARSMPEALDRMRGHGGPDGKALGALVQRASSHKGPWPTVSIWHGTADHTVALANMDLIAAQWRGLHGAGTAPDSVETTGNHTRSTWRGSNGTVAIERHAIAGMGHGTPIDPGGPDGLGHAMPHMLDVGVPSTLLIAQSWGLDGGRTKAAGRPSSTIVSPSPDPAAAEPLGTRPRPGGVQKIIEDALRTAGLMR